MPLVAVAQPLARERHPPAGQVGERRHAHLRREAARERRARERGALGQLLDRPAARRVLVQRAQHRAELRVARGAEPRRRLGAQRAEVLAQDLDERDVEQAVQQRLLAGLVVEHLARQQVQRRAQRAARRGAQPDGLGQQREQPRADVAVEDVGAAEELRALAALAEHEAAGGDARGRPCTRAAAGSGAPGAVASEWSTPPRTSTMSPPSSRSALAVGPQVQLALDDRVHREAGHAVELQPERPADRRVRERRPARPRALQHVGENVHDARRSHM